MLKRHYEYCILFLSLIISAILRILIPFSMVFQNGRVIYNAADAYYHMRYVDLLVANYPQYHLADPYIQTSYGNAPLWNLMIVWFGKLFNNIDVVAAYLPAILGVLIIIPVFVIAKRIFDRKVITSLTVVFTAIISGLFYARTQLGAADYHALEVFLLAVAMMWLSLLLTDKSIILRFGYGFLALETFYFYYLTWGMPAIICSVAIICFAIYIWGMLKLWDKHKNWFKSLVGIPLLAIGFVVLSHIGYFGYIGKLISVAIPTWYDSVVAEGEPLLFRYTSSGGVLLDLSIIWGYFGLLFIAMLAGLGMLIYRVIKHRHNAEILLLAWSVVMFVMTLIARRWDYYFAINVSILSAMSIMVIVRALIKVNGVVKIKRLAIACLIGFIFVFVPFIRNDVGMALEKYNYPTKGWQEASTFLRSQLTTTQDDSYYHSKSAFADAIDMPYVLSWWDYGYFLYRESHIPVISHGGGLGHKEVAELLISDDKDIAQQLKERNIKYIVIDDKMVAECFYSMVNLANDDIRRYYVINEDKTITRRDNYYDTLLAKLYFYSDVNCIDGIELVFQSDSKGGVDINGLLLEFPEVKVFEVQ